jgi:hypothetical protein
LVEGLEGDTGSFVEGKPLESEVPADGGAQTASATDDESSVAIARAAQERHAYFGGASNNIGTDFFNGEGAVELGQEVRAETLTRECEVGHLGGLLIR